MPPTRPRIRRSSPRRGAACCAPHIPWPALELLSLVVLALMALAGCDESRPEAELGPDLGDSDQLGDTDTELTDEEPDLGCPSLLDPDGDVDQDDLPNVIEDKNQNCVFDAEILGDGRETNAFDPDTDGDGFADGVEDTNHNGRVDPGERDPRFFDDEFVPGCFGEERVDAVAAGAAASAVALPPGFWASELPEAQATLVGNPSLGAYGFVWASDAGDTAPLELLHAQLEALAPGPIGVLGDLDDNIAATVFEQAFVLPDPRWTEAIALPRYLEGDEPLQGARAQLRFAYGAGAPNPGPERAAVALRDQVLSALTGVVVDTGLTSTPCERVDAVWLVQRRSDPDTLAENDGQPRLVVSALFACDERLVSRDLAAIFDDLYGGTLVAPRNYSPRLSNENTRFLCETFDARLLGRKVDYLVVVDNSLSMLEEQPRLGDAIPAFFDRLQRTGLDWRLAVTTSEAYLGFGNPPDPVVDHDDLRDAATSLRGVGFLRSGDNDAVPLFREYVARDEGCEHLDEYGQPTTPPDLNLCGSAQADGLASGTAVLAAMTVDPRDDYALRDNAQRVVLWLSDDEAQSFVAGTPSAGIPPEDPRFAPLVDGFVADYGSYGAQGFALVGDPSLLHGGACRPPGMNTDTPAEANPGHGYRAVAHALGGGSATLCQPDFTTSLEAIADASMGADYPLEGYPIASSIRVAIGATQVPRSTEKGWDYDPHTNALRLFNWPLRAGDKISVSYIVWGAFEEVTP